MVFAVFFAILRISWTHSYKLSAVALHFSSVFESWSAGICRRFDGLFSRLFGAGGGHGGSL
jgi:hypothetical protein